MVLGRFAPRRLRARVAARILAAGLACFAGAAFFGFCPGSALAQWPQFRGPDGQGHSAETDLPLTWSDTEGIAWRAAVPGVGWSSPVIDDGRVWLTTAVDEGKVVRAMAINVATGAVERDIEVFRIAKPPAKHAKNSFASPTPVIEGGRVFVHFGTMGTAAIDAATGEILWKNNDFTLDHEVGPGSSPIVYKDMVILTLDGTDTQRTAALDQKTGAVRWMKPRPDLSFKTGEQRKAFCTPLIMEVAGAPLMVSPGAQRAVAYDPNDGREVWTYPYDGFSNVPRPVTANGLVYICTGFGPTRIAALRPEGSGELSAAARAWENDKQAPTNPSPLIVGDEIYMISDRGIATCMDVRSGKIHWKERLGGNFSSSPILGAGRIYVSNEEGATFVLRPGTTYKVLAENKLDGVIMASPAAHDGALFIRAGEALLRIGRAAGK